MSVELRELVIKATVVQEKESKSGAASGQADNNASPSEQLISTCIDKILEILKDKDGR